MTRQCVQFIPKNKAGSPTREPSSPRQGYSVKYMTSQVAHAYAHAESFPSSKKKFEGSTRDPSVPYVGNRYYTGVRAAG